jgi:hypothetical protein
MKAHLVSVAIAIFLTQACTTNASKLPAIEQSIYHPVPPLVDLKQSIYVRERERPLLRNITNASEAIIRFLMDVRDAKGFVFMTLYCWKSDNEDQLKFLVEWADVTTKARYTDSYVFARRGSSWYFEKHGGVAPYSVFQRPLANHACPLLTACRHT